MEISWDLLTKYISKECSDEERQLIEARMQSDPELSNLVKMLRVSSSIRERPARPIRTQELWDEFNRKVKVEHVPEEISQPKKSNVLPLSPLSRGTFYPLRIAAALLLTFTLSYFLSDGFQDLPWQDSNTKPAQYEFLKVENGKRVNISLTDGSYVTLDSGSEFKYFNSYENERHVYLKGEALFNIAPDDLRPFYVHAEHAVVRVVGTKFNVRAWKSNPEVAVTVVEGVVKVNNAAFSISKAVSLKEGQQGIIPIGSLASDPINVDAERYIRWMQNEIHFEDASVSEVIAQLHRWYNYKFEFQDPEDLEQKISIHIHSANVNEVIEVISLLTSTEVVRSGNQIKFVSQKQSQINK